MVNRCSQAIEMKTVHKSYPISQMPFVPVLHTVAAKIQGRRWERWLEDCSLRIPYTILPAEVYKRDSLELELVNVYLY